MINIPDLLEDRGKTYGSYNVVADMAQDFISYLPRRALGKLSNIHKDVIYMIFHKLARAVCGDIRYNDNYVDIIGYATLLLEYANKNRTYKKVNKYTMLINKLNVTKVDTDSILNTYLIRIDTFLKNKDNIIDYSLSLCHESIVIRLYRIIFYILQTVRNVENTIKSFTKIKIEAALIISDINRVVEGLRYVN